MKSLSIACFFLFYSFPGLLAQEVKYIALNNDKVKYTLHSFYVASVIDSVPYNMDDLGVIGKVVKNGSAIATIKTNNGLAQELQSYFDNNTSHPDGATAMKVVINNLDISVKANGKGYNTSVKTYFSIYAGNYAIQAFKNESRITSSDFPYDDVQSCIKSAINRQLQGFDEEWKVRGGEVPTDSIALIKLEIAKVTDSPDCIVFNLGRKLAFDDFKSNDYTAESFAAGTSSGLKLEYSSEVEHSKMVVNVKLTPVFYKSKSWFKPEAKVDVLLAHEQTHFDITAIIVCEMATKIKATSFTVDDFDKKLLIFLNEFTKMKDAEGVRYDAETDHGRITVKQIEWQNKVNEKLKEVGCY